MTTITQFTPSSTATFQFQPTLDSSVYTCTVTWNLFGQRYYVNLYDQSSTLIFCLPLIGSVTAQNLSSLTWSNGTVTATTDDLHGYAFGSIAELTVAGTTPTAYSGVVQATITGDYTFSYSLSDDPGGDATTPGTVASEISLTAGYFTSTMIFRDESQQFEVSP